MKIQLTITAVLSCLALEASAFWRMLCSEQLSIQMIDPIVNPGAAGKHVHHIQGPDSVYPILPPGLSTPANSCQPCPQMLPSTIFVREHVVPAK